MSADVHLARAEVWGPYLEDREAARSNIHVREARPIVARRVKVAPGTLENLRKRRLKGIATRLYEKLRLAVMREMQAEVRQLEHELQTLSAMGVGPADDQMAEVQADIRKAKGILSEGAREILTEEGLG